MRNLLLKVGAAYRFRISTQHVPSLNSVTDIEVPSGEITARVPRYDMFLRKFQYTKALDAVLVPYIRKKKPFITVGLLQELIRFVLLSYSL